MAKTRLDLLLMNKGYGLSREKIQAMILAGEVWADGKLADKPGAAVQTEARIEIISKKPRYVSRGGLKLEKAIEVFGLDFNGRTVLDVGASTGGYTDCALQHGATKVYALDVGYGQLDWALRNDGRVVVYEKTNIRYVRADMFKDSFDIITIDVSFISVQKVFLVLPDLLKNEGQVVCLIKPQFEVGKGQVGKKGVVRSLELHGQAVQDAIVAAYRQGLYCKAMTFSPLKGPQGNIEFFILMNKTYNKKMDLQNDIMPVVIQAHQELGETNS